MKKIIILIMALCMSDGVAYAAKTTYIATNHRFNFVKLKEVRGSVMESRQMTHPVTLDEQGLRTALASIKLSRSYLIKKEVDTQRIFDDTAIDFLAPALVRAFAEAGPNEQVVFSYLSKSPIIIIRNDRLNICEAWIRNDELHIKFEKLFAKITMDIDKRGNETRAIAQAQGLRVKLELGEGQNLGVSDPDEVVLNLHYNYAVKPEPEKEPEPTTMAGEKVPQPQEPQKGARAKAEKGTGKEPPVTQASEPDKRSATERLKELEQLKKDKLVSKKEYEEKRKEILKGL